MLFILALILRSYGLGEQPPTDDEVGAASAATSYMEFGMFGRVMWYHPPLRNIVIYLSGLAFGGYSAWGLRFGSVIFGSLTIPVIGYLGKSIFQRDIVGYLAAFFLCIDPLHISLSREAFQETTTTFLLTLGALAAWNGISTKKIWQHYVAGVLFGLATASKWHGFFPWSVAAITYVFFSNSDKKAPYVRDRILIAVSAYIVLPLLVYTMAHIPWLMRGYSLKEFLALEIWLAKHQYIYVGSSYTEDVLSHKAWQWFLWPVAWVDYVYYQGKSYVNIAIGNFMIWALTLPSLILMIRKWFKNRLLHDGYLLALFLVSYLPLILTTRSIWVFAAPAVLPFAFLMSASTLVSLLDRNILSRKMLTIYLCCALVLSIVQYPLATFKAMEYSWARPLVNLYNPHNAQGQ